MIIFFLIITTISLFKTANSVQPWPFPASVGPQPYPKKVDLELELNNKDFKRDKNVFWQILEHLSVHPNGKVDKVGIS